MKSKKIVALLLVIAAVGVGVHYYRKQEAASKVQKTKEDVGTKSVDPGTPAIIADPSPAQTAEEVLSTRTPGIVPEGMFEAFDQKL